MKLDQYQRAWRADTARTRVTIDPELVAKEVQRSQSNFRSMIFWRDVREVGISLVMIPIWFVMGIAMSLPSTWYLTIPALIWVSGFILVDRRRHPQRSSDPGEPLVYYVKEALTQVEHQIWLLRNVFWWYLLPFCLSIMAFFLHVSWNTSRGRFGFVLSATFWGLFLLVIYGAVYLLNQFVVRKQLQPRRRDLLKLVANLEGEESGEDSGDLMELGSAIASSSQAHCSTYSWAENWNRIIPSWRVAAQIIIPTLGGAMCGLLSGLCFRIHDMGPTLFQTVVGAVLPFQVFLWWRIWRTHQQSDLPIHQFGEPASEIALSDTTIENPRVMPSGPAIVIIFLILFLGAMALVAIVSCVSHFRAAV